MLLSEGDDVSLPAADDAPSSDTTDVAVVLRGRGFVAL